MPIYKTTLTIHITELSECADAREARSCMKSRWSREIKDADEFCIDAEEVQETPENTHSILRA